MTMSQLTLYNALTEVTGRPLPQPLSSEWSAWSCLPAGRPQGGKVTARPLPQPLSIRWRGWPQAGRGPTGWGRLRLRHIGSPAHLFRCQFNHSIHSTTTYYIKSGQISHGEKFEERIDIMSHKGKIARLPLAIREQLNRRLQDGEIGRDLVVWLNSAPEVQADFAILETAVTRTGWYTKIRWSKSTNWWPTRRSWGAPPKRR